MPTARNFLLFGPTAEKEHCDRPDVGQGKQFAFGSGRARRRGDRGNERMSEENYSIKTEQGEILVTKAAMSAIVKESADAFEGKVFLTNPKGKFVSSGSRFGYSNEQASVEVECNETYPRVTVYIAVKFGTSIAAVTNEMIEMIHDGFLDSLGFRPESVSIMVTGTISKNIAKRNIEVVKTYDDQERV